jgi:hypothetical protein
LQSYPLIHVNDPTGLFTSDDLTRVDDAVAAVVEPWGVCVTETAGGTSTDATLITGSTSSALPNRQSADL